MKKLISVTLAILISVTAVFSFPASAEEECEHEFQQTHYYNYNDGCGTTFVTENIQYCHLGGYIEYTCTKCGDSTKEYHDYFEHDIYLYNSKEPTCTSKGYNLYKCSKCNLNYYEYFSEALGHNYIETDRIDSGFLHESGICRCYNITKVCSRCDNTISSSEYVNHEFELKILIEPVGFCEEIKYCTNCGYYSHTGNDCHNYVEVSRDTCKLLYFDDPDIVDVGFITYQCTECNMDYEEHFTLTHSYKFAETVAATCYQDGYDLYRCSECGREKKTNYTIAHTQGTILDVVEPTCTTKGYTVYGCGICGAEFNDSYTAALGHTKGDDLGYSNDSYSCHESKTHKYSCSVCNVNFTVEEPPIECEFELIGITESDCYMNGSEHYKCKNCNNYYFVSLPLREHQPITRVENTVDTFDPCCYLEYTECYYCSYLYSQKYIYKHNYISIEKENDCDHYGYTMNYCDACLNKEIKPIEPTGHTYSAVEITDTLGKKHTLYCCDDCSHYNGDLNSDSRVDLKDLVKMKKELANLTSNTVYDSRDCTQDGLLNSLDLTYLRKTILGTLK